MLKSAALLGWTRGAIFQAERSARNKNNNSRRVRVTDTLYLAVCSLCLSTIQQQWGLIKMFLTCWRLEKLSSLILARTVVRKKRGTMFLDLCMLSVCVVLTSHLAFGKVLCSEWLWSSSQQYLHKELGWMLQWWELTLTLKRKKRTSGFGKHCPFRGAHQLFQLQQLNSTAVTTDSEVIRTQVRQEENIA